MAREPKIHGEDPASRKPVRAEDGDISKRSQTQPVARSSRDDLNDESHDEELRPRRLEQVVGQSKVVNRLKIALDATRQRGDTLGHLLLDGPPGLGKTTLATVIPRELGVDCQIVAAPTLTAPKDLLPYLTNLSEKAVLFIDEVHRLPAAVEEFLYPAMEDFRINIALGEGLNARTYSMPLKPFTVIGATTRSGLLTAPLKDRFVYKEHLDFYSDEELREIVVRNARKLRTQITEEAAAEIACRSQGTPRKANNILLRTRDFATLRDPEGRITDEIAKFALDTLEIDSLGLDRQDKRYLETLLDVFAGGPAGVQAIAHSMSLPADTLEDDIEPFLLRSGLIQRSSRGRVATPKAYQHLARIRSVEDERNRQRPLFDEFSADR
jgi:Holliday junction DNA helicase RuvB